MEASTLWVFLTRLDVLVRQIDAFDNQGIFLVINRKDFASHGFIFAADDSNRIAVMNLHFSRRILMSWESRSFRHFPLIVKP